jgi:hypothetical protein
MTRLMRHAADLLDAAETPPILRKAANALTYSDEKDAAMAALVKAMVAQATAAAMLRMVAAAMDDEPAHADAPSAPSALTRGPDGRFRRSGVGDG